MTTEMKRSEHNPFRTPTVTPNTTGAGPSSASMPMPSSTPQPQPTARPPSPPRQERSTDELATSLQATTLEDDSPSEPPPAYTPSANPYEGEATVEYGPHRPFQPAPPAPPPPHFSGMSPQHQYTGNSQGSYFMNPQATGMPIMANSTGGWGQYPGQASNTAPGSFGPPPRHPSTPGSYSRSALQVNPNPASTGLSDFARDFYASSPTNRIPSPIPSDGSSTEAHEPEHFEAVRPTPNVSSLYSPPSGPPPSRYVPPNGPPPSSSPSTPYAPPSGPPPSHPSNSASSNLEDSKPTSSPTPGRPLLNKGRVLVYPRGFECKKCLNTGYKNFDPSHPCRKCWERYAKTYSGAVMYAPNSQQSQRPLPRLRPPHLRHQPSHSQPSLLQPSSSSNLSRSQSAYRPNSSPCQGYPGRAVSNPNNGPGSFLTPQSRPMATSPQLGFSRGPPPPGSVVVTPGDSRIGGRLCWRCDGSGTVSFLIFDIDQCPICKGVGRTFQ